MIGEGGVGGGGGNWDQHFILCQTNNSVFYGSLSLCGLPGAAERQCEWGSVTESYYS